MDPEPVRAGAERVRRGGDVPRLGEPRVDAGPGLDAVPGLLDGRARGGLARRPALPAPSGEPTGRVVEEAAENLAFVNKQLDRPVGGAPSRSPSTTATRSRTTSRSTTPPAPTVPGPIFGRHPDRTRCRRSTRGLPVHLHGPPEHDRHDRGGRLTDGPVDRPPPARRPAHGCCSGCWTPTAGRGRSSSRCSGSSHHHPARLHPGPRLLLHGPADSRHRVPRCGGPRSTSARRPTRPCRARPRPAHPSRGTRPRLSSTCPRSGPTAWAPCRHDLPVRGRVGRHRAGRDDVRLARRRRREHRGWAQGPELPEARADAASVGHRHHPLRHRRVRAGRPAHHDSVQPHGGRTTARSASGRRWMPPEAARAARRRVGPPPCRTGSWWPAGRRRPPTERRLEDPETRRRTLAGVGRPAPLFQPNIDGAAAHIGDLDLPRRRAPGGGSARSRRSRMGTSSVPGTAPANPERDQLEPWRCERADEPAGRRGRTRPGFTANGAIYIQGGRDGTSRLADAVGDAGRGRRDPGGTTLVADRPRAGRRGLRGVVGRSHGFVVGGDVGRAPPRASRANLAPQPPFFQLGLIGVTCRASSWRARSGSRSATSTPPG